MASSYDISLGTARVQLSSSLDTFVAVQVTSESTLDADITVLLQHSTDGINFEDLGTATTITSGVDGVLLESFDYTLADLYIYIDVQTATVGTINFFQSSKKKEDSSDVTATITGEVDAKLTNSELDVVINSDSEAVNLLRNILRELKLNNKLLNKILN